MPRKWNRKVLTLKREAGGYGVDATPTGSEAVLVYEAEYDPEYTYTSAKRVLPYLARSRGDVATKFGRIKGWVELAGAGAAGTVPAYGAILRACSFAEVNNPGVDTQYNPISTGDESASAYWNMDGQLHKLLGLRGMISAIRFPANDIPQLGFEAVGLPQAPTDTAMATPDFTLWKPAIVVNKVNTPTFTIDGYAAVLRSLEVNLATVLELRDLVNANDVQATDREPVGTVVIEDPTIAGKNFYPIVDANTRIVIQLIHGVGGGKIVQLDMPKVQLTNPKKTNVNGVAYLTMNLGLDPNAGNDELKITVK
ncbi:hypothetical protein [Hypericibacter sp.]|uniref:hypothetical protein n=1 Tax=Hypericibacter sp. TaxID=2705401 RepID=UPI003D6D7A73